MHSFDDDYKDLLNPLLFTILYLGFQPKISQTRSSSTIRINQIKTYIKDSKFGIHDLSRCRPLSVGELPRFNMPYELGLDSGCLEYGTRKLKTKKLLILETEKYYYQKVLSDIAGQDIENHNDDPRILVQKTRNWFSSLSVRKSYPSVTEIWSAFSQFHIDLIEDLNIRNGRSDDDIDKMPVGEFIRLVRQWIASFKP